MGPRTRANGIMMKTQAVELRPGPIVRAMKESSYITARTVKAVSSPAMAVFTVANGYGASNTANVRRNGLTAPSSRATMSGALSMAMAHTCIQLVASMKANGRMTSCMVKEPSPSPTVGACQDSS